MNDLFSSSFKRYTDLKRQVQSDLESASTMPGDEGGVDLSEFFEDVDKLKEELQELEMLHRRLQETNEEAKLAHSAKTVKALRTLADNDVAAVLRRARVAKGMLQGLDRSNAEHRKLPGCGPGTSTDRSRTAVVVGLGKSLKDVMDGFQALRAKMSAEYRETVERRYFTVTGRRADERLIEELISTGESETLVQRAIEEQGRGQVLDVVSEIQERHDAVREMERGLQELHQVFLDMSVLVEAQGQQLNSIECHVMNASSFVRRGSEELVTAKVIQRTTRKWACIGIGTVLVVIILVLAPILFSSKK